MIITTYAILFIIIQNVLSIMVHFNQLRNMHEYINYDNNALFKMAFERRKAYSIKISKILIPIGILLDIILLLSK